MPAGEMLKHSCGLFGIIAPGEDVAWRTASALYGMQTRGEEGVGIATTNGERFFVETRQGLVIQAFPSKESVSHFQGHTAIGHIRYSTTGESKLCNVQPLVVSGPNGEICLGHNGNLVNAQQLRERLQQEGVVFESTTDSEVIAQLLVRVPGKNWVERLRFVMALIKGSYCLVILTKDSIILARDPTGNRPLTIGRTNGYWAAASESGVFNNQPTEFLREVEPGEIVVFQEKDEQMLSFPAKNVGRELGLCVFEWLYFMRPDSKYGGKQAAMVRYRAGRLLAKNYPVNSKVDYCVAVPRSGFCGNDGFSHESGIPSVHGVVTNIFSRGFTDPNQQAREEKYDAKYSFLEIIDGKNIVVVEDSIVRGNSNNRVIHLLKRAGVKSIHMRVTYPLVIFPCYLGIDMSTPEELIAVSQGRGRSKEEIEDQLADYWQIDSVRFLTVPELIEAIDLPREKLCLGCVGGRYATPFDTTFSEAQFKLVAV